MKLKSVLKNRKGDFTVNEFLSVLVAVVGIALIVFGIVKLYGVMADDEAKNAKATLDRVISAVESVGEGQNGEVTIQGFKNSNRWYLLGWSKNDDTRPDKCYFDSCICVCNLDLKFPDDFVIVAEFWPKGEEPTPNFFTWFLGGTSLGSIEPSQKIKYAANCQTNGYCAKVNALNPDLSVTSNRDQTNVKGTSWKVGGSEWVNYPIIPITSKMSRIAIYNVPAENKIKLNYLDDKNRDTQIK